MSFRTLRTLTNTMTLFGLVLILVGGVLWWRQSRTEAALLSQEENVLLAVTSDGGTAQPPSQPSHLPGFDEAADPQPASSTEVASTPTSPPSPTPSEAATAASDDSPDTTPTRDLTPTPGATATPDPFPPASTVPERLVAPSINLDATVTDMGWEVKTDGNGNEYSEWVVPLHAAGWHVNSELPGAGGNTVLSGHHNVGSEVFRYVVNLEPGDRIELFADDRSYRYVVKEKYIVKEKGESLEVRKKNNRYIENTSDERLTLVTCWPYETNTHRVIVVARPDLPQAGSGQEADRNDQLPESEQVN